jgi:FkbM family methyltransferase
MIKSAIKTALDKLKIRPMYFGVNLYDDFRRWLPNQRFSILFDVGANEGQTIRAFRSNFPNAMSIHCFEPNPDCCKKLGSLGVTVHQTALGNEIGEIGFDRSQGQSDMYFVTHDVTEKEKVFIETLDAFCERERINQIDFLNIDTEGYDLNVILGASKMLSRHQVDIVQAEVSMNAENTYHVPFAAVHQAMESFGYRMFGVYEQGFEWGRNVPVLRRSNVVYTSPKTCELNRLH